MLAGEPGEGKSALAAHAARLVLDDGAAILYGGCDEDLRVPYQPFAEAIAHYLSHASDSWQESYVRSRGAEFARLAPSLAGRPRLALRNRSPSNKGVRLYAHDARPRGGSEVINGNHRLGEESHDDADAFWRFVRPGRKAVGQHDDHRWART